MPEIPSVRQATAKHAGLYANKQTPDPREAAEAKTRIEVSKLDSRIRAAHRASAAPDDVHTAHLVGLLLMWGGSDEHSVARVTRSIREALSVTPNLTDADRQAIARMVLASGDE